MADDLVQRLRALAKCEHSDNTIGDEAADEIERLRAELADMRSDRDSWRDQALDRLRDWGYMRDERDALKARIDCAPVGYIYCWIESDAVAVDRMDDDSQAAVSSMSGKRVALVVLD